MLEHVYILYTTFLLAFLTKDNIYGDFYPGGLTLIGALFGFLLLLGIL